VQDAGGLLSWLRRGDDRHPVRPGRAQWAEVEVRAVIGVGGIGTRGEDQVVVGQLEPARPARCSAPAAAATASPPDSAGSSGRIRATFMDRPTAARTSPGAEPARTTTVLELRRIGSMLAAPVR